jgi:hypothetical protein
VCVMSVVLLLREQDWKQRHRCGASSAHAKGSGHELIMFTPYLLLTSLTLS